MIGKTISHYKILEKLGEGGMGVVYKAQDSRLKRMVALKFLPPDLTRGDEAKERFMQEAQAASKFDHPNICTIYEIDATPDGQTFIAMAHLEGQTLKQKLAGGAVPADAAVDTAIQVALGLTKAHEKEIVHRDIKPANIMLTNDGPADLQQIVAKALAKEPDERYQQMDDMRTDLSALKKELKAPASKETAAEKRPVPSIAVLPFVNMSADPENEYFCDGMAEELIDAFTKLEGLKVASRTSAFQFKGKEQDIQKIGQQLKVNHLLEGSVRKAGNRLRITAQLINVENGYHLWSEKYDRELEDVFAIQDDIAHTIVNTLKIKLVGELEAPLIKRYTENIEAYQLYLKGRYFWNKRHAGGLQQAMQCFKEVLEKESGYALAYSGLADSYNILGWYTYLLPNEAFPKAKALAQKALEIDDSLGEAYSSVGFVSFAYEWDWLAAERAFKRSIALSPDYSTVHWWYAFFLMVIGRTAESLAEIRIAQELDPLSLLINACVGWLHYLARQHDRALEQCLKTLDMDPSFGPTLSFLGIIYEQKKKYDKAIEMFRKWAEIQGGGPSNTLLAHAYALAGKNDEARKILKDMHELRKHQHVSAYHIAAIYLALDENDRALEWLEIAIEERNGWLTCLKVEPAFDSLRSDVRFTKLLQKIGLEK